MTKNQFKTWLAAGLMFTVLLAACGGAPIVPPTSTPVPTAVPTALPPTITPTPTEAPPINPAARKLATMTYDPVTKRLLLFGGEDPTFAFIMDAVAFSPEKKIWQNLGLPNYPITGLPHNVYNSRAQRLIIMDTSDGMITWAYDPKTNTLEKRAACPGCRPLPGIAYDSESDKLLTFGGTGNVDLTWVYDYSTDTWTDMKPALSPGGREYPCMEYSPKADRILMFAGIEASPLATLWTYDYNSNTWEQIKYTDGPNVNTWCTLAYDEKVDRFISFGGRKSSGGYSNETWSFDLNTKTWQEMKPEVNPGFLSYPSMAYDPVSGLTYLFGGENIVERAYSAKMWAYDFNANSWVLVSEGK